MKPTMRLVLIVLAATFSIAARAQGTFEIVGKIADEAGNGVAGVKIVATNVLNTALTREGVSDKKGNYWMSGLPYSQQGRFWTVAVEASGQVPAKAAVIARMGNRTIYDEYEKTLGLGAAPLEIRVMGIGEVRIDFTIVSEEKARALAPTVAPAGTAVAEVAVQDPFDLATRAVAEGDLEGSIAHFTEAVDSEPTDPERRELFSRVLLKLERTGEALVQAKKAVEVAPDRASSRLTLADVQATMGNLPMAKASLAEARRLAPDDLTVLRRISWVAAETDDVQGAIEANEAIVAKAADDTEAWLSLGDLYNQNKQPDKSEQAYRKVTELDPQNAYKTFFNLGALIENRSDLTESDNRKALEAFRKAIAIKSDYALAHRHLAYALLRAGDLTGAKKSFQAYLALDPRAADAAEIRQTLKSLP